PRDRQQAYMCDVTYCTNKELVFDYLRDHLALRSCSRLLFDKLVKTGLSSGYQRLLLRGLHFAIVDEADSVLIDEARTPLILSGMSDQSAAEELHRDALDMAAALTESHYRIGEQGVE